MIRRNCRLRVLQKFRNLKDALLDDLVEFFLNVAHEIPIGENVHEAVAEPEIQVENIEDSFEMNQVDDCLGNREWPADLSAQPVECYCIVSAVLACEL